MYETVFTSALDSAQPHTSKEPGNQVIEQGTGGWGRVAFAVENSNGTSINARLLEPKKMGYELPIKIYPFDWEKNNEEGKAKFNFMSQHDLKCELVLRGTSPESIDLSSIFIMVLLVAQNGTIEDKEAFAKKAEKVECIRLENILNQSESRMLTLRRVFSHINHLKEYFINLKCLTTDGFADFKDWSIPSSIESFEFNRCIEGSFGPCCIRVCEMESLKSITIEDLVAEDTLEIQNLPNLKFITIKKLLSGSRTIDLNQFPNLEGIDVNGCNIIFDRDIATTVTIGL